jgi:hypothetical protein
MRIRRSVRLLLVCAVMLAGLSAPALAETQALVVPAASLRSAVWIGVAPTSVLYGRPVTVTATLVNSAGRAVPGRTVALEQCTSPGVWTKVKSASSSTGRYTFVVYPGRKTYYRVRFAGDATYYASVSAYQLVSTTARLTGPVISAARVYKGTPITVSGYLMPRHTAGTNAVTLQAWKLVGGAWQLIRTYSAPITNFSTYSRYWAAVNLPYTGSWRIRAVHADADHVWTGTGWAWVTVLSTSGMVQTVFSDNFNGYTTNLSKWAVGHKTGPNPDLGGVPFAAADWGPNNTDWYGRGGTAYCAQTWDMLDHQVPNYPGNLYNWMVAGPFDFSGSSSGRLTFDMWVGIQTGTVAQPEDEIYASYTTDGSTYYNQPLGVQLSSYGWKTRTLDLSHAAGKPRVWVAFIFLGRGANSLFQGVYVDNVKVTRTLR